MKFFQFQLIIMLIFLTSITVAREVQWAVVGAGPAGIAVVGLLLDAGVSGRNIAWVDPEFSVGRLSLYGNVPGNAKTQVYVDFVNACKSFQECNAPSITALKTYDMQQTFSLHVIVEPLKDITTYLKTKVLALQTTLVSLDFTNKRWIVGLPHNKYSLTSDYVVLATGAHPRRLDYPIEHEIPLDIALNKTQLANHVSKNDSIAVVGSAHSAILVLKFLSELAVSRIINFYKHPIIYATEMDGWVLHQHAGLKGITAQWAREVLEKNPPANIVRVFNDSQALKKWLPLCNKIVYAVGLDRNELPPINGSKEHITYNDQSGDIGPRLFGIGVAFPEKHTDPQGNTEYQVGLKFFMEYAQRMVPEWMKKDILRYKAFEDLFEISLL